MSRRPLAAPWQQAVITLSQTVVGVVVIAGLYWGRPVLIPIALAILLTILLNPIVRWLQRVGMGRVVAVILTVSLAGIGLTMVSVIGSRQITRLLSDLPANTAKIIAKVKTLKSFASGESAVRFERMIEDISHELKVSPAPIPSVSDSDPESETPSQTVERIILASEPMPWLRLTGHLSSAVEAMATLAFTMVLLMFFLMESEGLRDRIVRLAGETHLTLTSKAIEDATTRVSRYIVMVEIVNGGFGLMLTIGLFLIGLPYAVLWGCVAALLRFLPYIGPWIGAVFPVTMSLAMSDGWWQPITVFTYVLALELITNNAIEPVVFGHTTGVAPTALLISAAFWLFIWGPLGLIISAPFALTLVVIGKNLPQVGFLNILLGDQPALRDDVGFYQRLLLGDEHEASLLVARRMSQPDPEHVFDDLMIPALTFAKRDLLHKHLSESDAESVQDVLRKAVSDASFRCKLIPDPEPSNPVSEPNRLKILGCSADGEWDRLGLLMLQKLLDENQWDLQIVAAETLTSELVASVAIDPPAAICVVALSPGGISQARYLCKRLRSGGIGLPLVIGRWGRGKTGNAEQERLTEAGANAVVSTLLDMRRWLDSRRPIFAGTTIDESMPGPHRVELQGSGTKSRAL